MALFALPGTESAATKDIAALANSEQPLCRWLGLGKAGRVSYELRRLAEAKANPVRYFARVCFSGEGSGRLKPFDSRREVLSKSIPYRLIIRSRVLRSTPSTRVATCLLPL